MSKEEWILRRIVKENHRQVVKSARVNTTKDRENLIATLSPHQINIYDNEHCQDYLDLVSHLPSTDQPDAWLAVGDVVGRVRIFSLAWSREIARFRADDDINTGFYFPAEIDTIGMKGGKVLELVSCPFGGLLFALHEDSTIRIWNLFNVPIMVEKAETLLLKPLAVWAVKAYSLCLGLEKEEEEEEEDKKFSVFVGMGNGEVNQIKASLEGFILTKKDGISFKSKYSQPIDLLKWQNGRLFTKQTNGRINVWNLSTRQVIYTHQHHLGGQQAGCVEFDVSRCGQYICIGSGVGGECIVYSLAQNGQKLENLQLRHKKLVKNVTCCCFARNDQNIIVTAEDGYIWRWDKIAPKVLEEWKAWRLLNEPKSSTVAEEAEEVEIEPVEVEVEK